MDDGSGTTVAFPVPASENIIILILTLLLPPQPLIIIIIIIIIIILNEEMELARGSVTVSWLDHKEGRLVIVTLEEME